MRTTWNTKRLYTRAGQRIAAELVTAKNVVIFADTDRYVDGVIDLTQYPPACGTITNPDQLKAYAQYHYDYGNYNKTHRPDYVETQRVIQSLYRYANESAPVLGKDV